jgi:hypothetical protein
MLAFVTRRPAETDFVFYFHNCELSNSSREGMLSNLTSPTVECGPISESFLSHLDLAIINSCETRADNVELSVLSWSCRWLRVQKTLALFGLPMKRLIKKRVRKFGNGYF